MIQAKFLESVGKFWTQVRENPTPSVTWYMFQTKEGEYGELSISLALDGKPWYSVSFFNRDANGKLITNEVNELMPYPLEFDWYPDTIVIKWGKQTFIHEDCTFTAFIAYMDNLDIYNYDGETSPTAYGYLDGEEGDWNVDISFRGHSQLDNWFKL